MAVSTIYRCALARRKICFPFILFKNIHTSLSMGRKSTFEDYQQLKRSLRTKQRIAGIPFALIGLTSSSMVTAYLVPDMFDATPDTVQLIMGLDPLVFSGICGASASLLGYVVGTNCFKSVWMLMNKSEAQFLKEKDADFLQRLEKFRFGKDSKFEDDYYGETIKTLSDYRQWVRTQQRKKEMAGKLDVSNQNNVTS